MAQHNRGTLNDLATYRLSTAEEDIKDAKTLFSTGSYRASIIGRITVCFTQSMQFIF